MNLIDAAHLRDSTAFRIQQAHQRIQEADRVVQQAEEEIRSLDPDLRKYSTLYDRLMDEAKKEADAILNPSEGPPREVAQ